MSDVRIVIHSLKVVAIRTSDGKSAQLTIMGPNGGAIEVFTPDARVFPIGASVKLIVEREIEEGEPT